MKEYILKKEGDRLNVWDNERLVSATDILNVYPDRRVYAFHGQMGAGKTTFIKEICEELGVEDIVNSPTFAIVNVYEVKGEGLKIIGERLKVKGDEEIYHFDCYRLKNIQEALDFGAEEYLYSGYYCFIEWPEIIEPILPEDIVNISITPTQEDGIRKLVVE